ncbi:MAG: SDR family oxidoreductase [Calditrichota bacterium]
MDFTIQTVFITGASSGIGEACARTFAAEGAKLILCARRGDRLERLAKELADAHQTPVWRQSMDVRDRDAVNRLVAALPPEFVAVDVLINNAGGAKGFEPIAQGDPEDWDWMLDTNVKGLLHVTKALLPGMIVRNRGHIINIGSIAGRQVYPNGGVYCAAKFAVRALTQGLLMELVNTNIRVTTVDPGLVETEFSLVRFQGDKNRADSVYKGYIPLKASDVADAVVFCAARPAHVNISELVIMPTAQASVYHVHKEL